MFKKVLNLVFNELKLDKVSFDDLIITKPDDYYSLECRDKSGRLIVTDFLESDIIEVSISENCASYISITRDVQRFYKMISDSSHFKLEIDNRTIAALIKNKMKFYIMTKNERPVMGLGCHDEDIEFNRLIGNNMLSFRSDKLSFEVFIPDDSEIRIYVWGGYNV